MAYWARDFLLGDEFFLFAESVNGVQSTDTSGDVTVNWRPWHVLQPLEIAESAAEDAADEDEEDGQKEEANQEPGDDHGYENHRHCHDQHILSQGLVARR